MTLALSFLKRRSVLFTPTNISQYGSGNENSVFKKSDVGKGFENDLFNVAPPSYVQGMYEDLPSYLVENEIFQKLTLVK